jgi:hypothetical protein
MRSIWSRSIGVALLLACSLLAGCNRGEPIQKADQTPSTPPEAPPRQPKPATPKSSDPAKALAELREAAAAFQKFRATKITANAQGELVEREGRSYRKDLDVWALPKTVSDADLAALPTVPFMYGLAFYELELTDARLKAVQPADNLVWLVISNSQLTDAGLKDLQKFANLGSLSLDAPQVTDAGLKHLAQFNQLWYLELKRTRATADGIKEFKRALPKCAVTGGP